MFTDQESSPYGILDPQEITYRDVPLPDEDLPAIRVVDSIDEVIDGIYIVPVKQHYLPPIDQTSSDTDGIDLGSVYDRVTQTAGYKRTLLKDVMDGIVETVDNAVVIPTASIDDFHQKLGTRSADLAERFRSLYLPLHMSFDHASATVEAFMRDGIDVPEFQVDSDISDHIAALIKLDMLCTVMKSLDLPQEVADNYLTSYVTVLMEQVKSSSKSQRLQSMIQRYKSELTNPVGVQTNALGSVRLRSRFDEKAKEEKDS